MTDETKKWLETAEKDFDTAVFNIKGSKTEAGLFFLQQAAEKALKAVYIKKFKNIFKTHDLIMLGKKVKAPETIIEFCKKINPAYEYTRYPDVSNEGGLEETTEKLIINTREIIKWAKKSI